MSNWLFPVVQVLWDFLIYAVPVGSLIVLLLSRGFYRTLRSALLFSRIPSASSQKALEATVLSLLHSFLTRLVVVSFLLLFVFFGILLGLSSAICFLLGGVLSLVVIAAVKEMVGLGYLRGVMGSESSDIGPKTNSVILPEGTKDAVYLLVVFATALLMLGVLVYFFSAPHTIHNLSGFILGFSIASLEICFSAEILFRGFRSLAGIAQQLGVTLDDDASAISRSFCRLGSKLGLSWILILDLLGSLLLCSVALMVVGVSTDPETAFRAIVSASELNPMLVTESGIPDSLRFSLIGMPLVVLALIIPAIIFGDRITVTLGNFSFNYRWRRLVFYSLSFVFLVLLSPLQSVVSLALLLGITGGSALILFSSFAAAGESQKILFACQCESAEGAQNSCQTAAAPVKDFSSSMSVMLNGLYRVAPPFIVLALVLAAADYLAGMYGALTSCLGLGVVFVMVITPASRFVDSKQGGSETEGNVERPTGANLAESPGRGLVQPKRLAWLNDYSISLLFVLGAASAITVLFAFGQSILGGVQASLLDPLVVVGVLVGSAVPAVIFVFGAVSATMVGRSVGLVLLSEEARAKADNFVPNEIEQRCRSLVQVAFKCVVKELVVFSLLPVGLPFVVGFCFGGEALGGMLAGALISAMVLTLYSRFYGRGIGANDFGSVIELESSKTDVDFGIIPAMGVMIKLMFALSLALAPLI